jgi:hypothetical protein
MRYSLRWLLLAMAYVALVAAAIGATGSMFVDILWIVWIVSLCYAFVVMCVGKDRRRAMAVGFVALSAAHAACIYLFPYHVPVMHVVSGLGYAFGGDGAIYEHVSAGRVRIAPGITNATHIANAVVTLAVGMIGCGIGALAYWHSHDP